ncbi:LysM peptidoglycan-binding domain-containing protein [Prevotella sp. 10(H)]|uniref:LysM peptidoglycan-binding domain-containing protein n=1 Tax=Prevotella sp. 10(H) TaxID=1158294 RepID=UPI0004A6BD5C|nr:LysM peptidoglycan-binding domain-containing protein [Prevotella sp. 10(H)]
MKFITRIIRLSLIILLLMPSLNIPAKSIKNNNDIFDGKGDIFANQALLSTVFEKLYNLENNKQGKINIVHIGDSHIQADFFTNAIREALQLKFGNGGFGFTFPYRLVRTNGTSRVKYICNASWQSLLNVYPVADVGVGLSGIALYTSAEDFVLQLYTEEGYEFSNVKIIYPTVEPHYRMSVTADPLEVSSSGTVTASTIGMRYHTVKSGEGLYGISRKYGVTITQIKNANGLKSNLIKPKQRLKIPVKAGARSTKLVQTKASTSNIEKDSIDYVNLETKPYYSSYTSDTLLNRITILPADKQAMYNLNGFVIENDKPGVIYHSIGVNGAKLSDYNKYPLFFEQLPILQPDLVILSFGTNESFGRLSQTEYIYQVQEFIENIKKLNPFATVLVMTPPPSMFRNRRINTYIIDYSDALMGMNNVPVWDLYTRMGGASGIAPKGQYARMIARDKVHYTTGGYQAQGELFASDFIDAYNNYKKNIKIEDTVEHK